MSTPAVHRHYVQVGERRVHYRRVGSRGPVIIALHPSPLSSAFLLPLAMELGVDFQILALDTPGYGLSSALLMTEPDLRDYATALGGVLDALGLDRVILYGQATGAQIALEFARSAPARVAMLLLEGCGYFAADELATLAEDYLPAMPLRADGAHLLQVWTQVRDLNTFFPWCLRDMGHALDRDPAPIAAHHAIALDYLRAGSAYARAYRAALRAEREGMLDGVSVPGTIIRAAGSVIGAYTDRMQHTSLPGNFRFVRCGADAHARACVMRKEIARRQFATNDVDSVIVDPVACSWRFVPIDAQTEFHIHGTLAGSDVPTLILHAPGQSMRCLDLEALRQIAGEASMVLDLPGHGESGLPLDWDGSDVLHATVRACSRLLDAEQCDKVNVLAVSGAAALAHELARQFPERICTITVVGAPHQVPVDEPDLSPRWDGSHLLAAWFRSRDGRLYENWDQRLRMRRRLDAELDAESLHQETLARLCCRLSPDMLGQLGEWATCAKPRDRPRQDPSSTMDEKQ